MVPNKVTLRLYELAYKHKLSHLSSCLTALRIIDDIYDNIRPSHKDIFILSSGHAALALYIVLEERYGRDAEHLLQKHGVHPHRDSLFGIECSTGSLGCGLPIAIGRAIAEKDRHVFCLISDGECAEGSIWESLRFAKEKNIQNLFVYVNMNGYCALNSVDLDYLETRLRAFLPRIICVQTYTSEPFLKGINGHYHILTEENMQYIRNKYA